MGEGGLYSSYVMNWILNAFLSYTAFVLNIVTIHAIRKTSSLPRPLKTLLLSLAVSDLRCWFADTAFERCTICHGLNTKP